MPYGITGSALVGGGGGGGGATDMLAITDSVQGYYGLLTNFYFVGGVPTVTEIAPEDIDQWLDINFDIDPLGTFDHRPEDMKSAQAVGHTGAGTQADPIVFSLEGLTQSAFANFRACLLYTSPSPRDRG